MKLIDKDALVAEINRVLNFNDLNEITSVRYALESLCNFINKLKVKDVNLEKEVNDYGYHYDYVSLTDRNELMDFAKHFFELGLKTQKG